jgi:hypothetical protein
VSGNYDGLDDAISDSVGDFSGAANLPGGSGSDIGPMGSTGYGAPTSTENLIGDALDAPSVGASYLSVFGGGHGGLDDAISPSASGATDTAPKVSTGTPDSSAPIIAESDVKASVKGLTEANRNYLITGEDIDTIMSMVPMTGDGSKIEHYDFEALKENLEASELGESVLKRVGYTSLSTITAALVAGVPLKTILSQGFLAPLGLAGNVLVPAATAVYNHYKDGGAKDQIAAEVAAARVAISQSDPVANAAYPETLADMTTQVSSDSDVLESVVSGAHGGDSIVLGDIGHTDAGETMVLISNNTANKSYLMEYLGASEQDADRLVSLFEGGRDQKLIRNEWDYSALTLNSMIDVEKAKLEAAEEEGDESAAAKAESDLLWLSHFRDGAERREMADIDRWIYENIDLPMSRVGPRVGGPTLNSRVMSDIDAVGSALDLNISTPTFSSSGGYGYGKDGGSYVSINF